MNRKDDPTYPKWEYEPPAPPDRAALLKIFALWVTQTPGRKFGPVLRSWVKVRVHLGHPVNPGIQDPNRPPARTPSASFRKALEKVFDEVRKKR